ncbi:DNA phosphorothioation-dependent restriction protein DptH [Azotobacter salinestris]|uniref:DNA phosphorothioation-dependent restriction protein DptH n=1 Tax=Azotobacter salinestris TaxID=69964 RepID=UPI0032DE7AB9
MSEKQFETFLTEHLRDWLKERIKPGDRFQFRSTDPENTVKLLTALRNAADGFFQDQDHTLSYLLINGIPLLIAGHADGKSVTDGCYTDNYVAKLRDDVVDQSKCLLMIHNSALDTITNSTFDLAQKDAVWSVESIRQCLVSLIDDNIQHQMTSKCLLDLQSHIISAEDASIFGFRSLYESMTDGNLRFDELGLFNDPVLTQSWSQGAGLKAGQIERRLEENRKLRADIEYEVEHYPAELEERLSQFGSHFIKKHFLDKNEAWKYLTFNDYLNEIDKQKEQNLEFEQLKSESCHIQARSRRETGAGLRDQHLLIQAPSTQDTFAFELHFSGAPTRQDEFDLHPRQINKVVTLTHRARLQKTIVTLTGPVNANPLFFTVNLNRELNSEQYKFNCVLLREGAFYLDDIFNKFLVNRSKQALVLQLDQQILKVNPNLESSQVLGDCGETIEINQVGLLDFRELYDESDEVRFTLKNEDIRLDVMIEGEPAKESLTLPLLMDTSRSKKLFKDNYQATYKQPKGTVVLENQEIRQLFLRQQLLNCEWSIIDEEVVCWNDEKQSGVAAKFLKHSELEALHDSYLAFLRYFKKDDNRRTLPSLTGWGPSLTQLTQKYIGSYQAYLESLPKGKTLDQTAKLVMKLGTATIKDRQDGRIRHYLTPFHPLVLAYYLYLIESIQADGEDPSFRKLSDVTLKRLTPRGLIPHVYDNQQGYGYTQSVDENPFWTEIIPREDTSFEYVTRLVRHKISEFKATFRQLFDEVPTAPILINSVNNAENRELFKGILAYYMEFLESGRHIHINLYDDDELETEFDIFAEMATYDEIKDRYHLDRGAARKNTDTIIDALRTRLTFSKFRNDDTREQKYAHLTFFKNNQVIDTRDNNIDEHLSGIACGGLLNGESSLSENGAYFTAFGLKGVDCQNRPHLKLARLVGSLWRPSRLTSDTYHEHSAIRLAVSNSVRTQLERSYDSSVWVTIIDPKVTLEFFQQSQDVVLIHYSDQYTSSAGYDAITVTKQSRLYRNVLGAQGESLICEFNAFNGEWLLQMVNDRATEKLAKEGVIGAYKVVSAMLSQSDICWIPLSVAEMIRVAGNIGLAMADSDFSRHNLGIKKGAISDDILFVGFKGDQVYLLPVEVKAGSRPDFSKARTQALQLRRYMEDMLGADNLASRLYRGLFVRQVLLQVEKYQLYRVFADDHFSALLDRREYWLEGEYRIGSLDDYPKGLVIAHVDTESCFSEKYEVQDDVLQVEIPSSSLEYLVHTPYRNLQQDVVTGRLLKVPATYFLRPPKASQQIIEDPECSVDADSVQLEMAIGTEAEESPTETPAQTSTDPLIIQFGTNVQSGQPVLWEPTNTEKLFNTNTGIIGTMGTGKTQFTKSLVTQLVHNQHHNVGGKPIGILIFDYKADYVKDDFVGATNAKVHELYHLPFNPFAIFGDRPMQPMHTANLFRATMAKAFGLGVKQQNRIRTLVMEAYEAAGIIPQDRSTWTRPAPTLADVWAIFEAQEKVEQDSLYAALDDLMSFEIFEPDSSKTRSLYDLVDGVTVINLSGYDPSIQSLVVALTLDLFYTQMHQQGSSMLDGSFRQIAKMILVDEADNFMSQDFESLKKILKEGREFGVGTILSTQELTHFKTGENDYSSLILSWVIHQVANIKPQEIKAILNAQNKQDEEAYMGYIRTLEKHHSLHVDGKKKVVKIKDLAFWELKH